MEEDKKNATAATRAKQKYNAKAYDQFLVVVPKGQKGEIDRYVKEQGYKSRNEFILSAIKEKMGK